jgi:tetratricopeptide (TPR) repeat protein
MDRELERRVETAAAAYRLGDVAKAAEFYTAALRRAREMDHGPEIGRAAYNLAVCLAGLGWSGQARAMIREARAELGGTGREAALACLVEGRVARQQGLPDEAEQLADAGLRALGSLREPAVRLQLRLLRVDVACDAGDVARARQALEAAGEASRQTTDPLARAEAEGVMARVATLENRSDRAAAHHDARAAHLQRAGSYRDMAAALEAAAAGHEKAGSAREAAERYFRCARCYAASGLAERARAALDHAIPLAERAGDETLRRRAADLREELAGSSRP